jgi:hypothetical protein
MRVLTTTIALLTRKSGQVVGEVKEAKMGITMKLKDRPC